MGAAVRRFLPQESLLTSATLHKAGRDVLPLARRCTPCKIPRRYRLHGLPLVARLRLWALTQRIRASATAGGLRSKARRKMTINHGKETVMQTTAAVTDRRKALKRGIILKRGTLRGTIDAMNLFTSIVCHSGRVCAVECHV